ncbi:hypothetical protein HC928_17040 [bacterium]|nr:hypothetical protein [bacterium]
MVRLQDRQILPGDTVLDKLLNQLSTGDRELILRLMTELGMKANDPTHPLLVAMQYYVSILRDIPAEMQCAADEAFRKALTVYGTIQTQIDDSAIRVESGVGEINRVREQWVKDVEALLPKLRHLLMQQWQPRQLLTKQKSIQLLKLRCKSGQLTWNTSKRCICEM